MGNITERFGCIGGRTQFWLGGRNSVPLVVGMVPFGITCGVMGLTAGLTGGETLLMSICVFAGASQFVAISMLAAGVNGWGIIVFTTLLVNLRHLLMGASLAPYIIRLPVMMQALLSFGMTDESYAITMEEIHKNKYNADYQLGANVMLYTAWVLSTAVGVLLSGYIIDPLAWGLDFAMPAVFLAMLIPRLVSSVAFLVCGVAALVAVVGALYLPGKWYIIAACLVAILVGGFMEKEEGYAN